MKKTLCEIFTGWPTDKNTTHSYGPAYGELFEPFRHSPTRVLEIGVWEGGSIAAWAEYFDHIDSRIMGLDCVDCSANVARLTDDSRIELLVGDAARPGGHIRSAIARLDIVIDDGPHTINQQIATFKYLWPDVVPGGLYVIEDIQSNADAQALLGVHSFQVVDVRPVKGRYDDVLLIARKPLS